MLSGIEKRKGVREEQVLGWVRNFWLWTRFCYVCASWMLQRTGLFLEEEQKVVLCVSVISLPGSAFPELNTVPNLSLSLCVCVCLFESDNFVAYYSIYLCMSAMLVVIDILFSFRLIVENKMARSTIKSNYVVSSVINQKPSLFLSSSLNSSNKLFIDHSSNYTFLLKVQLFEM